MLTGSDSQIQWFAAEILLAQQRWLWYRGAQVSTFGTTQIVYLPRDWLWALTVNGARTCFPSSGCAVVPSDLPN